MEFFETVASRQSIRAFASTPIGQDRLDAILNATNRAPSAGNFQSFEVYLADTPAKIAELTEATFDQHFVAQAPVALIFCTNPSRCQYEPRELYALEDATIACTFAMLAATAAGLATCWIGAFRNDAVAKVIGAPSGQTPVAILPIGYAAERPEMTPRRALADLVHKI